jgi:CDP-4-dehydro-6-deoxyglucose reductase, E1
MSDMPQYPLATSSWAADEYAALARVTASGRFSMGPEVKAAEAQFADFLGVRHTVMVNSGSSANLLMVGALMYRSEGALAPGDEVLVPAVSWPTTYYPLHQYGLRQVFVDVDLDTLNYDLDALAAAVTDRTRAVMTVNLLGNPNDFDRLQAFCDERGLILIEDNCESLGATFNGRQAGTFGQMGTYSSFFSHHISTMEGGYISTDDDELHHLLLALRAHGWTRDLPEENLIGGRKNPDPFMESFHFFLPGYNVRPIEMEAALAQVQVSRLPEFIEGRRRNARTFLEIVRQYPQLRPQSETGESSWFGFSMIVDPGAGVDRKTVLDALSAAGVEYRPIVAGNFTRQPVLKHLDHRISGDLKNAEIVNDHGFFVGNQEKDLSRELTVLDEALGRCLDRR